jgi:alginate O-acetyltransferase complex protein AlgI
MTFNSLSYFFFLPLVVLAFYYTHNRYRWLLLLLASYGFYATFRAPQLLFVLALVTGISYAVGRRLGRTSGGRKRKWIFWSGLTACVSILAVMKYLPTHLTSLTREFPHSNLLISIGVSYFTLQACSYLIDIYLDIQKPEHHLGVHALSLAFFPKLLQGPIERAGVLLPQLKQPYQFNYNTIRSGMLQFSWGLFKKVVIADRLAQFVNPVFGDVHSYTGVTFLVIVFFYAFQIYCDFSGYTDMALGTARLFNIELTQNFKSPYLASSIADFWRRWHISFSRWILDYIFKPIQLAWREHGKAGTALALMITFLASGIWHGSTWGFVVWGLLHGLYLATSVFYKPFQKKLYRKLGLDKTKVSEAWKILVTFNLVCFAWIFFRSNTVSDGCYIISSIARDFYKIVDFKYARLQFRGLGLGYEDLWMSLSLICLMVMVHILEAKKGDIWSRLLSKPAWVRWPVYYMLTFSIVFLAPTNAAKSFIYMQF